MPEDKQESYITEDKGHGRKEVREVYVLLAALGVFKEDEQSIYAGDSALNMACCRLFVQNLFRKSEENLSVPRKMNKAAWDKNYRAPILFTSN
ncbi:hypothetical protein BCT56_03145 [Vibrio lentus]|uniref:Uncharacterized protein n=1 Tax=Vibrio lentus TaxID=136468 RepID=A0AB36XHS0_9VIBR|nr:hypothetical protein BCU51_22670 [Vibrio lentus]PMK31219.1 hypothetical protein BCU02_25800 [Vibrio lentus]PMK41955.1 hypothetical protein BCT99_07045 [Vibrio lentus]PML28455.1 hypothetical protein BCT79_25785 [Vibrio lentus]PMM42193.1 hypothetical protein BCT56_03145 [Vibrio lentus]